MALRDAIDLLSQIDAIVARADRTVMGGRTLTQEEQNGFRAMFTAARDQAQVEGYSGNLAAAYAQIAARIQARDASDEAALRRIYNAAMVFWPWPRTV